MREDYATALGGRKEALSSGEATLRNSDDALEQKDSGGCGLNEELIDAQQSDGELDELCAQSQEEELIIAQQSEGQLGLFSRHAAKDAKLYCAIAQKKHT